MNVYIRNVVRRSKKRDKYALNFPSEIIEEFELKKSKIMITTDEKSIIITKINNQEKTHISKTEVTDDQILI